MRTSVIFCEEVTFEGDGRPTLRGTFLHAVPVPVVPFLARRFAFSIIVDLEPKERMEKIRFRGRFGKLKVDMDLSLDFQESSQEEFEKPFRTMTSTNLTDLIVENLEEPLIIEQQALNSDWYEVGRLEFYIPKDGNLAPVKAATTPTHYVQPSQPTSKPPAVRKPRSKPVRKKKR